MEQEQLNEVAALAKVLGHFEAHKPVWTPVTQVADSVARLTALDQQLRLSAVVQTDGTTGDTQAKNLALDLSASLAYTMSRRIYAWAKRNGKTGIAEAVNFSATDLNRGAEEMLLNRYALVLQYAEANKTELAAFKVSDSSIDELERSIGTFKTLRAGRDDKANHRIFSTASIASLIQKVRDVYDLLDAEVEGLIENQDFVETYFIARRKTDRKATRAGAQEGQEQAG